MLKREGEGDMMDFRDDLVEIFVLRPAGHLARHGNEPEHKNSDRRNLSVARIRIARCPFSHIYSPHNFVKLAPRISAAFAGGAFYVQPRRKPVGLMCVINIPLDILCVKQFFRKLFLKENGEARCPNVRQ